MTIRSPLFAVIVPTHGRPLLLVEALRSVLDQEVDDLECIVVDDGSPEPVDLPDDPRVRLVRRDRRGGAAAARNTGLEHARGRYVTFLDDDDFYTPDRLAIALEGLSRAPLSVCWMRRLGASTFPIRDRILEGNVHDTILESPVPHFGTVAVERALAPRLDERFVVGEGLEWWIRASPRMAVSTVPRVGYISRVHSGPRLNRDLRDRLDSCLLLLEVHAEYFAARPRAAAAHWGRAGSFAWRLGDQAAARAAFRASLRHHPDPRTLARLVRSLLPRGAPVPARAGSPDGSDGKL